MFVEENGSSLAVVIPVGPGVPAQLIERSVGSVVAGLSGAAKGMVVVCMDGPDAAGAGVVEGLSFDASVPVEVWSSSWSLGRYGVDRVVVEMLGRIAA